MLPSVDSQSSGGRPHQNPPPSHQCHSAPGDEDQLTGAEAVRSEPDMAGDWIKMRMDLRDDPSVISIAIATGISEDETVGKLHRLWGWADRHTTDGRAPGINALWVDRYVGRSGFSEAMVAAGWLSFTGFGVEFPNFDRHNGASAKKRMENTLRQRFNRANNSATDVAPSRDPLPRSFRSYVYERDNYTCVYCDYKSDPARERSALARLGIDHLIPAKRGGKTVVENLVTACTRCNMEKSDRTPEEWGSVPVALAENVTYVAPVIVDCRAGVARPDDERATREEKRREEKTEKKKKKEPSAKKLAWDETFGFSGISPDDLSGWKTAYPACDIARQLAGMDQWLKSNPEKAHKTNWRRFVTNWLARAQDRGGDMQTPRVGRTAHPPTGVIDPKRQERESMRFPEVTGHVPIV